MVCKKCKRTIPPDSVFCKYCGSKVEPDNGENYCRICHSRIPSGTDLCEVCAAREEAAPSAEVLRQEYARPESVKRQGSSVFSRLLTGVMVILAILFIFIVLSTFKAFQMKLEGIVGNIVSAMSVKQQTIVDVWGSFKTVCDLYVLRKNEARYYEYVDPADKRKWMDLIIRFHVTVRFDIEDIKVEKADDREDGDDYYSVILSEPVIEGQPDPGAANTGDKEAQGFAGIEIFDSHGDFTPDADDKVVQDYIDRYISENKKTLTDEALKNLKTKLQLFAKNSDIKISEIEMQGEE